MTFVHLKKLMVYLHTGMLIDKCILKFLEFAAQDTNREYGIMKKKFCNAWWGLLNDTKNYVKNLKKTDSGKKEIMILHNKLIELVQKFCTPKTRLDYTKREFFSVFPKQEQNEQLKGSLENLEGILRILLEGETLEHLKKKYAPENLIKFYYAHKCVQIEAVVRTAAKDLIPLPDKRELDDFLKNLEYDF